MRKTDIKVISELEKNSLISKSIESQILKERSLIGKQQLLADTLVSISSKRTNQARDHMLILLLYLHRSNERVTASLQQELASGKKLLSRRIEKTCNHAVKKELQKNLWKVAEHHFRKGNLHLKHFNQKNTSSPAHAVMARYHHSNANDIYQILVRKDILTILKKLAFTKLAETYAQILLCCKQVDRTIEKAVNDLRKNGSARLSAKNMAMSITNERIALQHFATNYSKSLIHSAEYVDHMNNRFILYHHR